MILSAARGEVWRALEGNGDTITSGPPTWTPPLPDPPPDVFWVEMVSLGVVGTTTLQLGLHNGDMAWGAFLDPSDPTLGWILSGERALRSRGDPGSADLGRPETQNFLPAALPALKQKKRQ